MCPGKNHMQRCRAVKSSRYVFVAGMQSTLWAVVSNEAGRVD